MKRSSILPLILMMLAGMGWLSSCEQEIELQLENADSRVVIEGWITDDPGPYPIKVTRTSPYLGDGSDVVVSGALLILNDDQGAVDTLVEVRPGWYETTHIQGQMQHTYTLKVTVGDTTYTASNYLPRINPIIGTGYEYNDTLIFGAGYYCGLLALEPAGLGDFYQFRFTRNDTLFNSIQDLFVTNDDFVDGQVSPFLYPYPCQIGDTVVLEVRAISAASYDFYVTVAQQGTGAGGPFASVPDNLATNFDNGAFGWFGAAATRKDTLAIQ
ncbi:MAG: DUF4249 family protein [Bacteroidia bacterium]